MEYILQRAKEEGDDVYEKVREIVEEGKARGSLTLKGLEKKVEVNGKEHVVKVIDGGAVEEDRGGRKLLRIRITAEVDGVRRDYVITFGRYEKNETRGFAYASAKAPGGRERRRKVLGVDKGPYGEGAEGVPKESRQDNDGI